MALYHCFFECESSLVIRPGDEFDIFFENSESPMRVTVTSRYENDKNATGLPMKLVFACAIQASDINQAILRAGIYLTKFSSILSFVTNSSISDCKIAIAYHSDATEKEHDYFQSFMPEPRRIPRDYRFGERQIIKNAITAIIVLQKKYTGLQSAINHYAFAINKWDLGEQLFACEDLWLCAESLKYVALELTLEHERTNLNDLMQSFGSPNRKSTAYSVLKHRVFKDPDLYEELKAISNEFEHIRTPFFELHNRAYEIRSAVAKELRRYILGVLQLNMSDRHFLVNESIGYGPVQSGNYLTLYLRGVLIGEADHLAKDGETNPYFRWSMSSNYSISNGGEAIIKIETKPEPHLGKDVIVKNLNLSIWSASDKKSQMTPIDHLERIIRYAENILGIRNSRYEDYVTEIAFDATGRPTTTIDHENKKIIVRLNNYSDNYEGNHAFLDELAHEAIHCLCQTDSREKVTTFEEGLATWFSIRFVVDTMKTSPEDEKARRDNAVGNGYGDALETFEQLVKESIVLVKNIRTEYPSVSDVSPETLKDKFEIAEDLAQKLTKKFYV